MMCRHLFGFSATTRATGALAAFTGTAVAAGGIPTACAFTGSACAIGGAAVVLYSGNGGAAMLVPVFEQGSPWSTAAAGRCVGVGSPSSMIRLLDAQPDVHGHCVRGTMGVVPRSQQSSWKQVSPEC